MSRDPGSLKGRVVIVTGGSRGLGAAVAACLGDDGARIVIADLALERAQSHAAALRDRGIDAHARGIDVGVESEVRALLDGIADQLGGIDAVVNSAAIDITVPIAELDGADWDRIVRTNLSGPFYLSKHAAAIMLRQQRPGHIVNVASTAAKRAWPNASAYHATKWGLLGLSHALHAELRPHGIQVCAVVAGGMRTPFLLDRFPDIDPSVLQEPDNVARAIRFVLTQPEGTVIPELTVLPMKETSWP